MKVKRRSAADARAPSPPTDFGLSISERLRLLMQRKGRSIEALAAASGLARNKLDAVAAGEAAPTINLVWKIANALGVPFGSLVAARKRGGNIVLRKATEKVYFSNDGRLTSRPLLPHDCKRLVEFYEMTIAPDYVARSEAHGAGTLESLVVVRGEVAIVVGKEASQRLKEGDAMTFEADVPHSYHNLGSTEALLYLVMSYVNLASF
ncbi:transcriptional regulator, XRE family [Methylocella silvestris BL2]|uniref:Transcriptional regulator, XRE family n=2 Tax=Methylocella silvestris TaxID=199596 RepID=B8EMC1_METSB|nr:transcriptional regulator, XRE family [Methylocella silvestris BL2]